MKRELLVTALSAALLVGCGWDRSAALEFFQGEEQDPLPRYLGDGVFEVGVVTSHHPWSGTVSVPRFDVAPGGTLEVDFDLEFDLRGAQAFDDQIEAVYAVLVGEPMFDADGLQTGMTGITLTSRRTVAGVALESYEGTLPVAAFGSRRASPIESVVEFPRAGLGALDRPVSLKGRFVAQVPPDLARAWYQPHVELFVRLSGVAKVVDSRRLGVTLNTWVDRSAGTMAPSLPGSPWPEAIDMKEFMKEEQVLPLVRLGQPSPPRLVLTLFGDIAAHGQSHLLSTQDAEHVAISNRSRFETPFVLSPGRWSTIPGMPGQYPATGLAGLFQGSGSIAAEVRSWLVPDSGWFELSLTGPDGVVVKLGRKAVVDLDPDSGVIVDARYELDLVATGEYTAHLQGCFEDLLGRPMCGGGDYPFTVALPMSFSTAVKPGTNFLVGGRYPPVLDINPAVAADVSVQFDFFPGSDPARKETWKVDGVATRFGYFAPEIWPPRFTEPGEYSSLLRVRWTDQSGNLWLGQQRSVGVVAPVEPEIELHGTRAFLFSPHPDLPKYGAFDRYDLPFEGGSSYAVHSAMSLYDHTFPYRSGDTLHVSTTYPLESVIGPTLSMEPKTDELRARLEELYLPKGPISPYPLSPRWRRLTLFPHLYKPAEDNFSYFMMEPGVMDQLPILSVNRDGLSPYANPEGNTLEAYVYLSVIRPGLPVLALAFENTFMAPCWIISPNDYGYRFHSSPNGDLPEDLYRVMAGLVVRDRETGKAYYDAYSAAIRILPPGSGYTAVVSPGHRPVSGLGARDHMLFLGLNTSGVYAVGHELLLGGTVMPPSSADLTFDIVWPSGRRESMGGTANRLGGFSPPRSIVMDEPGVYRVKVALSRELDDGQVVHGDVVGSGDGEILYFALREDTPRVLSSPLPSFSQISPRDTIELPLQWNPDLQDVTLRWSFMTPGALFDEGSRAMDGASFDFPFRPRQAAIQLPNFDTVNYATGADLLTDIAVFVFFVEGRLNGELIHDAIRLVLRGDVLINPDALINPDLLREAGPMVGAPPGEQARYPASKYSKPADLDDIPLYQRD